MNTEKKGAAEATPCKVLFSQLTIVVMTSEEAADVARLGSDINSLAPPKAKGQPSAVLLLLKDPYKRESNAVNKKSK